MADSDDADDFVDSFDVLGTHFGWLDDHGPDHLDGVSRYPDFPNDMDWTGAFLDPLSEAIGRYVSVCSQLEIALFRVRSELDLDMTFAEAEWKRGPKGCLVDLREIAHTFPQAASDRLLALLHEAERYVSLRNGVVHGTYRRNYRAGIYASRRYVLNKSTKKPELVRVPYDRDSLLLSTTRANNVAADLLDGLAGWRDYVHEAARARRGALGPGHPLRVQEVSGSDPILHALAPQGSSALCGVDVSNFEGYRDMAFEDSNRAFHCLTCRRLSGL